jgi:hypothetical protein
MTHAVFLLSLLLFAYQAEQLEGAGTGNSTILPGALVLAAVFDGLIALYFRRKRLSPALEKLRRDSNDTGALTEWRFSTLLSLVLAESIALYGFVLRFMGASRRVSWPFFVCALILMVVWRPQLELSAGLSGTEPNQ